MLVIRGISKWKVLGLFLSVFIGKHISFKEVDLYNVDTLSIKTNKAICFQVDGQTELCSSCNIAKDKQAIQIMGSNVS